MSGNAILKELVTAVQGRPAGGVYALYAVQTSM